MNDNQSIDNFNYDGIFTRLYLWLDNYEDITTKFNNFLEGDVLYDKMNNEYFAIIKRTGSHLSCIHNYNCRTIDFKIKKNLLKIYRKRLNKDIEMKLLKND